MTFTLMGLLFVLPQYLQSVTGNDALNTGVRLLPLMVGVVMGAKTGERLAARFATRIPVGLGLTIVAAGMALGSLTTVETGFGKVAAWTFVVGTGTGIALGPAMDAVLGELPAARSGSGMALTMTLRQVGGALGVALLGSLSSSAYVGRLDLADLSSPIADAARESINSAVALADSLGATGLLDNARAAYVHAMAVVLIVCACIALIGGLVAASRLPDADQGGDHPIEPTMDQEESRHVISPIEQS